MHTRITTAIDNMLKNVPGVIGVILVDWDGHPIYLNGRFDVEPDKLGALTSICHACCTQVGEKLGQQVITILAEYENLKLYQIGLTEKGQMIILTKTNEAQFGMLRLEAHKTLEKFSQALNSKD
ncbi:MAG: roadblock/LC7 domain-containing protein [candidate division KSB1 bacterium]|nr:roadblock/LC7 domain-containing protein [candidate division KSB1 bacterium]